MAIDKQDEIPESVRPFYDKGLAALERNNLDYAMDMLEAVLKEEPRLLQTRRLLRMAAIKKDKRQAPGKSTPLKSAAALLKIRSRIRKDPLQALQLAERTLNRDPFNLRFTHIHCDAAQACQAPEIAIQTLELLREQGKAGFKTLLRLADLYEEQGRFEQEYDCRENMIQLNPGNAQAEKKLKDAAARLTMNKSDWKTEADP